MLVVEREDNEEEGEEGGKCLWWRGWTMRRRGRGGQMLVVERVDNEEEGRRGANACGGEGGQ